MPDDPSALVLGIDHVIIAVRDLSAAAESFERLLARAVTWRGTHPGLGTANALIRLNNTYLELIAATGEGSFSERVKRHLETHGEGVMGCVFAIRDATATSLRLRAHGIAASDPRPGEGINAVDGQIRRWRNVTVPADAARGAFVFAIEHLSPPDALPLAPVLSDGAFTGLDHVVLRTGDAEAAKRLYGEAFGIRLALDRSFPQFGARLQFFRAGGVSFEVASPLEPPPTGGGSDTFGGIALRTDDIEASQRRLSQGGFDVSDVRTGRKAGTRVFTVRSGASGVPLLAIADETR